GVGARAGRAGGGVVAGAGVAVCFVVAVCGGFGGGACDFADGDFVDAGVGGVAEGVEEGVEGVAVDLDVAFVGDAGEVGSGEVDIGEGVEVGAVEVDAEPAGDVDVEGEVGGAWSA